MSTRTLIGGLVAAVVIAVIVACAFVGTAIGAITGPHPVTVNGAMQLSATTYSGVLSTGSACTGTGGYADISPGANVTLHAASGELLAATHIVGGTWSGPSYGTGICTFAFTFGDVVLPGTAPGDLFTVQVGNEARGSVPFTREQLTSTGARLSLGS